MLLTGTAAEEEVELSWDAADDDLTPQNQLRYFVYQSSDDNIGTVADCETNGTLLNIGGTVDITDFTATGLTPDAIYFFNVVVSDMANNKTAYTSLKITTLVGIETQSITSLWVYPNPTSGELRIMNNEPLLMNNVEIYDVYGKSIVIPNVAQRNEEFKTINISNLANGVYFLRIQTEQGVVTKKIIKQ
jgi:hypothetical protein